MSELPEGWLSTELGQAITLNYGKSLPAKKRDGGLFPVYGSNGIVGQHSESITAEPTIVVGRKGSFGEVHFCEGPCFPIDTTYFVDQFDCTDPRFAFHLLRHLPLTEMNRASAIPGLNRQDAYSLEIGLPPLPEQSRIAAKVDGLAARTIRARKDLDRIPALIARYKRAVLETATSGAWISEASRTNVKLKDVIESIRTGPFGSAVHKHDYVVGGVPLINPMHINDGKLTPSANVTVDEEKAKELAGFELSEGDVIIARRGVMGRCAVIEAPEEGWLIGTGSISIRAARGLDPYFLQRWLSSPQVVEALEANSVGSTMTNLNQSVLLSLDIVLPSEAEQREIVERIDSAFKWLDRVTVDHAAAERLLPKLDAAILEKALHGKLVPQDPNDEPASGLLERIQAERAAEPKTKRATRIDQTVVSNISTGDEVVTPLRVRKETAVPKSRQDEDVWHQPYLAEKLRRLKTGSVNELFAAADLPVADFYKQLDWEIQSSFIKEQNDLLKVIL